MVNFGLYGSNWTAMDLKFKKTLLTVMEMNAAYTNEMKITLKSIINLGMFAKVNKFKTFYIILLNILIFNI